MNINRSRPPKDGDVALWLSGLVNDALRDAIEAGLPRREAVQIVLSLAQFHSLIEQHAPPCARLSPSGTEHPTCAYLKDGTKVVVRRTPETTGPAWLEIVQQDVLRPQQSPSRRT